MAFFFGWSFAENRRLVDSSTAPGLPGGGVALAEDVSFLLATLVDVSVSFEDITVLLASENFTIFPEFFMAGHLSTADFVGRLSISDFRV